MGRAFVASLVIALTLQLLGVLAWWGTVLLVAGTPWWLGGLVTRRVGRPGAGQPQVDALAPTALPPDVAVAVDDTIEVARQHGYEPAEAARVGGAGWTSWAVLCRHETAPVVVLVYTLDCPHLPRQLHAEASTYRGDGVELNTKTPDREHVGFDPARVDLVTVDADLHEVLAIHDRRLAAEGGLLVAPSGSLIATLHDDDARDAEHLRRRGLVGPDGRWTLRGAYLATWRQLPPWSIVLRRRRRAVAAAWR